MSKSLTSLLIVVFLFPASAALADFKVAEFSFLNASNKRKIVVKNTISQSLADKWTPKGVDQATGLTQSQLDSLFSNKIVYK